MSFFDKFWFKKVTWLWFLYINRKTTHFLGVFVWTIIFYFWKIFPTIHEKQRNIDGCFLSPNFARQRLNVMNGAGNYCIIHCAYHMRSSFIDFRDGRFTEGVINWLRVAEKDLQKRNLFFTCVRTAANTVCKHLVSPFRTQRSFINFHSQIILDSILLNVIWNSRTPLVILIWCNPTP